MREGRKRSEVASVETPKISLSGVWEDRHFSNAMQAIQIALHKNGQDSHDGMDWKKTKGVAMDSFLPRDEDEMTERITFLESQILDRNAQIVRLADEVERLRKDVLARAKGATDMLEGIDNYKDEITRLLKIIKAKEAILVAYRLGRSPPEWALDMLAAGRGEGGQ
jgi:hypothetical protein